MLEVFGGPFRALSAAQQAAVRDLTTRRFAQDLLELDVFLARSRTIEPGTAAFGTAHTALVDAFRADLAATDAQANIVVIFAYEAEWRPVALHAMRIVRGSRPDLCLSASVGRPDSSLQTHAYLSGFRYPRLPGFDPNVLDETHILELRRWVSIGVADLKCLVDRAALTSVEADFALRYGTAIVSLGLHRLCAPCSSSPADHPYAAYLWTCAPRSAVLLRRKMGLNFRPLFAAGCEPTPLALSPACFAAPLFERYGEELEHVASAPGHPVAGTGPSAALRRLAAAKHPRDAVGKLSLPYALLFDAETFNAFDTLDDTLTAVEARYGVRVVTSGEAARAVAI